MFRDFLFLEKLLDFGRKLIPKSVFEFFQPWYHGILALSGAVVFGFPSRKLKVIGVTGSKGKSTTVYLITKFLEAALRPAQGGPAPVAAIGSLGFKIGDKEWPNTLKMTMPGRWKIQKFLAEAVRAGCKFAVLEITSEGIKQKRHLGIKFDTAVFTNLEKEHIESHGSFEKYYQEKQKLFKKTKNIHILNSDSLYVDLFSKFPAKKRISYSLPPQEHSARSFSAAPAAASEVVGHFALRQAQGPSQNGLRIRSPNTPAAEIKFQTHLIGEFNFYNILAAAAVVREYGISDNEIQEVLDKIKSIPGRLEFIDGGQDFKVVVDYAHTPESLEAVYKTLKEKLNSPSTKLGTSTQISRRLICVLGAAGGGRDKWKRPIFGQFAENYCDQIILTNEDPYDEPPERIVDEIISGIKDRSKVEKIMDRKKAIKKALTLARKGDIIIITGKGSEISMAVAGGKKIPWSDKDVVLEVLKEI